jgi:hypothetical protein
VFAREADPIQARLSTVRASAMLPYGSGPLQLVVNGRDDAADPGRLGLTRSWDARGALCLRLCVITVVNLAP